MKESINNVFTDILHNDIITKTKSTIHGFVSGVKNLFRHNSGNSEEDEKASAAKINNYLKSPEEIEAEFKSLSATRTDDINAEGLAAPTSTFSAIINKSESNSEEEYEDVEFILPDYMEENY